MNNYSVYKHTSPSNKIYIGITCRKPETRWGGGKNYHHNSYFTNAINLYGWDNFKHEILFSNLSKEEAISKEKELIKFYQSNIKKFGYNILKGGEINREGLKHSQETKDKISKALKNKPKSEEHRKKIVQINKKRMLDPIYKEKFSKAQLGRKASPELRKKLSEIRIGHKLSDEAKEKIRQKQIESWKNGRKSPRSRKIGQYDKNNILINTFDSISDAYKAGFKSVHISSCCNGKRKTALGYKWRFLND